MLVERLRKEWHEREHVIPIHSAPNFTSDGLVMGSGTVLVAAIAERQLRGLEGQEGRLLALLAAAYGRSVPRSVIGSIERAAKRWGEGQDGLALIHLALAGLAQPDDRREAARRLFMADGLMKAGISPEAILQALVPDAAGDGFARYDSTEFRVPAGDGRTSGQWAKVAGALRQLTKTAAQFLERMAAAQLEIDALGLAKNPYVLAVGLILVPKTTNLTVVGDVAEMPGLRYAWRRDQTTLRLGYAGREIAATLEADEAFHDGDKIVARLLPDGTLAIDPAEVSSDLADKDGPNLCPKPVPDKDGRGTKKGRRTRTTRIKSNCSSIPRIRRRAVTGTRSGTQSKKSGYSSMIASIALACTWRSRAIMKDCVRLNREITR